MTGEVDILVHQDLLWNCKVLEYDIAAVKFRRYTEYNIYFVTPSTTSTIAQSKGQLSVYDLLHLMHIVYSFQMRPLVLTSVHWYWYSKHVYR
jgi:hypothetical protein